MAAFLAPDAYWWSWGALVFRWLHVATACVAVGGVFFMRVVFPIGLKTLDADPALRRGMGQASRSIVADYSCDKFATSALLAAQTAMSQV